MSGAPAPVRLAPGMRLLERGWLSSNNIVIVSPEASALIDSGYVTHAEQTLALIDDALDGTLQTLRVIQ